MVDILRCTRLLADARYTADKLPRTQLFKIHNIVDRTGYRILKEETVYYNKKVHNRGRKQVLVFHECETIEIIEDVNFDFTLLSYIKVIRTINMTYDSKYII